MSVVRREALKKVTFGRTGWQVTEVCAGTMTWGSFNAKEEEAFAQLDKIYELGINFIDTAELYPVAFNYGKTTEQWIGNWLTKRIADGSVERSKLYIATKVNPGGVGNEHPTRAKQVHGYDEEIVEWSCRKSIERMNCGYIDLYQIHWPSRDTPLMSTPTFRPADENGKIKNRPMGWHDRGGQEDFDRTIKSIMKLFELGLIRQYFRKARDYVRANASVPTAGAIDEAVAKVKLERRYASHRRPAPSEYQ